jgi:hypothetical protein
LQSTVWQVINDTDDFENEFNRILMSILNSSDKPKLGKPPKFTNVITDSFPGLNKIDTIILNKACTKVLREMNYYPCRIGSEDLLSELNEFDIPKEEFFDSLEILDRNSYIKMTKVMSGHIPDFEITHFGLDQFLRSNINEYNTIYEEVCHILVNNKFPGDEELAVATEKKSPLYPV